MPDIIINVSNVSKYFEIYTKPQDRLKQMLFHGHRTYYRPYWALRDISFDIHKGECVGIVGRNGAGKSTLLQLIAGTLTPSSGRITVHGRVAALLELGSGFNPEFTGRENVYLNAAILGMERGEIDAHFDNIAAFADIGSFIDRPVASYSSGMVVRLAFAIVAHVNADVLIVDEALAVGDAFFQQKCMRFLLHFMQEHTVLFVSHDTAAVNKLCNKAILLEGGFIKQMGDPQTVTESYLRDMYQSGAQTPAQPSTQPAPIATAIPDCRNDLFNTSTLRNDIEVLPFNTDSNSFGKGGASIEHVSLTDSEGRPLRYVVGGCDVVLRIIVTANKDVFSPIVGFFLRDEKGQHICGDNTFLTYAEQPVLVRKDQKLVARFAFTMPILPVGKYSFSTAVAEGTQSEHVQHDWRHDALKLRVLQSPCTVGLRAVPMQNINLTNESPTTPAAEIDA